MIVIQIEIVVYPSNEDFGKAMKNYFAHKIWKYKIWEVVKTININVQSVKIYKVQDYKQ